MWVSIGNESRRTRNDRILNTISNNFVVYSIGLPFARGQWLNADKRVKAYDKLAGRDYQNNEAAESAIFQVAWALFAFKRNWVQQVHSPSGELVGGMFYADSLGADIVTAAHRYGLLNLETLAGLFGELLRILDNRYGHEETKHSHAVKQELGEFTARQCTPLSSRRHHSDAPRS